MSISAAMAEPLEILVLVLALAAPLGLEGQGVPSFWRAQENNKASVLSTRDPRKGRGVWMFRRRCRRPILGPKVERN